MVRILRTKARPGTTAMEVMTVTIWMITTLGIVTAAVAIRIMRPVGV